jgi:SAM-dependent methyltransferase
MRRSVLLAALTLSLAGCAAVQAPSGGADPTGTAAQLRKPDVRYAPSPHKVVRAMLELAEVKPGDVVYDLGSGDGRIAISAARDFGVRAVGIEIDGKLIALANENARQAGVADRVQFRHQDLFEADIGEATVVTLFLFPDVNRRLRPKLLAELRPGTRLISHWHSMGDWQPDRKIWIAGRPLYLWKIGQAEGPGRTQPEP